MQTITAFAVVPIDAALNALCYTSAPEILGGGTIYQIYTTRKEAEEFVRDIVFSDAKYEVVPVEISAILQYGRG